MRVMPPRKRIDFWANEVSIYHVISQDGLCFVKETYNRLPSSALRSGRAKCSASVCLSPFFSIYLLFFCSLPFFVGLFSGSWRDILFDSCQKPLCINIFRAKLWRNGSFSPWGLFWSGGKVCPETKGRIGEFLAMYLLSDTVRVQDVGVSWNVLLLFLFPELFVCEPSVFRFSSMGITFILSVDLGTSDDSISVFGGNLCGTFRDSRIENFGQEVSDGRPDFEKGTFGSAWHHPPKAKLALDLNFFPRHLILWWQWHSHHLAQHLDSVVQIQRETQSRKGSLESTKLNWNKR